MSTMPMLGLSPAPNKVLEKTRDRAEFARANGWKGFASELDQAADEIERLSVSPDVLAAIADTLEARADAGDPLSPAELRGVAATLRSGRIARPAFEDGTVVSFRRKLVPGRVG